MARRCILAALVVVLIAVGPAFGASTTTTGIRIGSHAAFVRVVIDFRGPLSDRDVTYQGRHGHVVTITVDHAASNHRHAHGAGVTVDIPHSTSGISVVITQTTPAAYVSYFELVSPTRLVIDLVRPYSSAPLVVGGCFTITKVRSVAGKVEVWGRVNQPVFEGQWAVVLRDRHGVALRMLHVTGEVGTFHYRITHPTGRQPGDVDVYDLGEKDGSLACLARAPVTLH